MVPFVCSLQMHERITCMNNNSDEDREARVDELLGVLGLEACSEVRVGNPLERGISGGEARRLSMGIGVADLESVRLLLLDEPTTVKDSVLCSRHASFLQEKVAASRSRGYCITVLSCGRPRPSVVVAKSLSFYCSCHSIDAVPLQLLRVCVCVCRTPAFLPPGPPLIDGHC